MLTAGLTTCRYNPDGSADYVGYRPGELDHNARWIVRTENQEAIGIALPATCDPEGYTAEKKKGNVKTVGGKQEVCFHIKAGYMGSAQVGGMEKRIRAL